MNLDLIKSFAVLAEVCHYGEASIRLNMSQPSLTKQIRRLEDLMGAPLFERGRQGTTLTAFGRTFLTDVGPILRHADHVWGNGLRAARGERGRLTIGFTFSSLEVMSGVLRRFQLQYPEIEVLFADVSSRHQIKRVREGSLDAGFVRLPADGDLAVHPVGRDRLALVYPHGLQAAFSGFDDERIRDQHFLALRPELAPGVEEYIQRLFRSRGFQPAVLHRVNESLTLLTMVSSGFGLALMHESALTRVVNLVDGVGYVPLTDEIAQWDVGLIWRKDDSNPVLGRFLDMAREALP